MITVLTDLTHMINRCCKHDKAVLNITTETKQQQQQQIGATNIKNLARTCKTAKTFLQVVDAKQNRVFLQPDVARYSKDLGERAISSNKIKDVREAVVDVEQRKAKIDHNSGKNNKKIGRAHV